MAKDNPKINIDIKGISPIDGNDIFAGKNSRPTSRPDIVDIAGPPTNRPTPPPAPPQPKNGGK